jgi:hypothetical protein
LSAAEGKGKTGKEGTEDSDENTENIIENFQGSSLLKQGLPRLDLHQVLICTLECESQKAMKQSSLSDEREQMLTLVRAICPSSFVKSTRTRFYSGTPIGGMQHLERSLLKFTETSPRRNSSLSFTHKFSDQVDVNARSNQKEK